MNILYYYFEIFKEYLTNKILLLISFSSTFIIYILYKGITTYVNPHHIDYIYWNFFSPFLVYNSMILFTIYYVQNMYTKNKNNNFSILKSSAFIIIIKLIWDIIKIIFLESNFIFVSEKSSLYPIFFIFLLWLYIYLIMSFIIPHAYFNQKKNYLHSYIIKNISYLILNLIFSVIFSYIIIFVISYLCAKIQNGFYFTHYEYIHKFIEDFLSIFFKVIFSHILMIMIIKTYKKK